MSVVLWAEMGEGVEINWLTGKGHRRNFRTYEKVLYLDMVIVTQVHPLSKLFKLYT